MSSGQGVTYQMVTLTQGLADVLIKDDSPDVLQGELWQFLNTDITTANLTDIDIANIMSMVDISFTNLINGLPEDRWHEFQIKETTWDTDPSNPGKLIPVTEKVYPITELWDAIRAKVYIKCCNARDGFLMRVLTEQRSFMRQEYNDQSANRLPGVVMPQQEPNGKGWRAL